MADPLTDFDQYLAEQIIEFYQDERDGTAQKAEVRIGPFTAFVAIGALQLAWRHPEMTQHNRDAIEHLARQLQVLFSGEMADLLEQGWDTSLDRPSGMSI
jgi:hypothetical protein